jgi:RNA polymerase sigma-70 factor (ECF subfamily)
MSSNLIKKFKNKQALDRLRKRDREAFTKAYDENVSEIYRFIYFKVGSDEEAKDITSAVFLKTWNHIQTNTLESAKTLRALFYKIARNAIIDHYRERGKSQIISIEEEGSKIDIPFETDEETRLDTERDIELIRSKLPLLKEEYREVLIMKFINELELEEISDITGKSKGNIRVLTHRALKALKDIMAEDEKNKSVTD